MANVVIDIASEFTGKKAFKQAETSVDKLNRNVKTLAKSFVAVYSAQKILSFGKASVKAFAEDDKAAKALGTTLKNLGLAYGANVGTVNGFISRLERQTGVLDDELRPAMDRLLRATGDVTKSQELLNLALDIAAGTGKSVTQVSQSLQKAYLGQTQALGRLGVGLSKAELSTSSFEEIQARLTTLFAGQAVSAADSYAGSLAKLTIAGNNAKETIGEGLIDALKAASGSQTVDPVVKGINSIANAIANLARETGDFIAITRENFDLKNLSFFYKDPKAFKGLGNISMTVSGQVDNRTLKNQKAITKLTAEQAKNQAKILKDKKLQAAIDKANLALNKGSDVFDMDKIQVAAALKNQAEQLGKATDATQLLQIANDTARLNVKKAIFDLETAIASGDEASITKATAKLNEELKILGAVTGQKIQMAAIETILKGLSPKELIDQKNLNEALEKIRQMIALLAQVKTPQIIGGDGSKGGTPNEIIKKIIPDEIIKKIPDEIIKKIIPDETKPKLLTPKEINKILEDGGFVPIVPSEGGTTKGGAASAGDYAAWGFPGAAAAIAADAKAAAARAAAEAAAAAAEEINRLLESGSFVGITPGRGGSMGGSSSAGAYAAWGFPGAGGSGSSNVNITVNTGVGDPNAIAEAISNVLREAQDRGTLTAV